MHNINVSSKECFNIVKCKEHILDMMKLEVLPDRQRFVTKLLKELYNELEYQHEVMKNPTLNDSLNLMSNDKWLD